jgi:hypothetical protein
MVGGERVAIRRAARDSTSAHAVLEHAGVVAAPRRWTRATRANLQLTSRSSLAGHLPPIALACPPISPPNVSERTRVEPRRHVSIIVLPAVLRSKVHVRSTWNPSLQWDAEKRRTVPDKICIALTEELTWSHLPDASPPLPSLANLIYYSSTN